MFCDLWSKFIARLEKRSETNRRREDRRPRRFRPELEVLEDRTLMSITVGPQWTSLGPAPITNAADAISPPGPNTPGIVSGAMEAIAVDPTNSNHIYVGTVNGGIWQTQNYNALNTNPWTTTTDQLPSLAIMSLAFSPVDSNVVYAGTGSISSVYGTVANPGAGGMAVGIYKTTDGGASWSVIGNSTFSGLRVAQVVATSLNSGQTLFAATADTRTSSGGVTTAGGIYRSDDGGNIWTRLSGTGGLPNAGVTDLVINPDNPNQLYAAVPGMLHGTTSSAGIYELAVTATGETTTNVTGTGTLLSDIQNAKNVRLSVSPASPNPIWAATFASNITGLFRGVTTAGNVTWSAMGPGGLPPEVYATDDIHFALAADPNNANLVYVGGTAPSVTDATLVRGNTIGNTYTGIAYLTSGGITAGSGTAAVAADPNVTTSPHSDARQLVFAGNQLLAVDDGGIYLCNNPSGVGETATANIPTWTSLIGNIAATEVYTAAIDSSNHQVIEAAQDNGIAVLNQGTATQIDDTDGSYVAVDNTNHIQYYEIGSFSSWTAIPDSTGKQYQPAATVIGAAGSYTTLIDGFDNALYYNSAPYALNAVNPASILVGGSGPNNKQNTYGSLYYSTDQGNTFTSIGGLNSGKTGPKPITTSGGTYTDNSKIAALAFGAANAPNAAYIALNDGKILYSSDVTQPGGGFVETNFYTVAGNTYYPANIVMDPNNSNIAFAVIFGVGVYETTNGSTWTSITGNLTSLMAAIPSSQINDEQESVTLFTPPGSTTGNPTEVLVGGLGGVYQLPLNSSGFPASSTWTTYGANLPNVLVDSLTYNQQADTLLAGTLGRGVWDVTNASQTIGQPQTLQITGSAVNSPITLQPDPNNPLNILVTTGTAKSQSIPLGSFQAITITTNGANVIIGSQATTTPGTTSFLNVPLTITGSSGGQLTVQDAGSTTAATLTVTNSQIGSAVGDSLFGAGGSLTYSGISAANLYLDSGSNVLNFDAANLSLYIKAGQYTAAGMQDFLFGNVAQVFVDNAAAVNAFYGPDTANRNVLTGLTPQQRFVQVLYLDVLGRAGAMSEIDGWLPVLNGSGGQAAVAAGIEQSAEAMTRLVSTWYLTYLGRAADPGGLAYWSGLLQTQTEEQVLSQILGSTEFFNRAQSLVSTGTANQRYVQALYLVLLNRSGSTTDVAYWVSALPQLGNAGVAFSILTSAECRTNQFEAYYQTLLHRPADSAGLNAWVNSGLSLLAVREGFEATAEFFSNG